MSELSHSTGRAFVESISSIVSGNESTETRRADVVRIDPDGTVWVRSHGSDGQMPCTKSSVSCETGDTVLISIRPNGRASIEGNYTHPATDDSKADAALDRGSAAKQTADLAHLLAVGAISDAYAAKSAAGRAEADATRAASAAESAGLSALAASASADSAASDAASAASNAGLAASSAQSAASDAASANESANAALTQLGTVEDVMGTLTWIHDHEVYVPATEFTAGETYYVLVDGRYEKVESPTASDIGSYYVYDHQATMAGFVQEHLTLTERGLYITQSKPTLYEPGDSDYEGNEGNIRPFGKCYVLMTPDFTEYYGPTGSLIARYGRGVQLGDGEGGQVATIDNKTMHITRVEVTEELTVNNWVWQQRASGNISFKWRES